MIAFWSWLDRHPEVYFALFALPLGALVWHAWRAPSTAEPASWRSRWVFPLLILATLVAGRWPQIVAHGEINPDESQFIAGALTLRHDPIFWRSVDGMTAGPLTSFALLPVLWLGLPLTFLASRLLAVLALALTFTFCFRLLLERYHRRVASLSVIPAVVFFASAGDPDFNHFSSEIVPLVLLSGACLALGGVAPLTARRTAVGGLLVGLTPWAKLQSAPLGAAIAGFAIIRLWRESSPPARSSRIGALTGAALAPAVFVLMVVVATDIWDDFWRSYVAQNVFYAQPGSLRALSAGSRYWRGDFATLGYFAVLCTALVAGFMAWRLRDHATPRGRLPLLASFGLLAAAIGCVLAPGRDFLHYTLLLLPPIVLLTGAGLGETRGSTAKLAASAWREILTAAAVGMVVALHISQPLPPIWGRLAANARFPVSELGALVGVVTAREPTLSVWGWQHEIYVEAAARQGTRSAYTYWELVQHPQREYFRRRYLADFTARQPAVFIDAIGESTFFFSDRTANGHESFPDLAKIVARDYCQVAELRYARVYVRRDVLARHSISQRELWRAFVTGGPSDYLDGPENQDLNRFSLPKTTVEGRFAMVMRPPTHVQWTLSGTERELRLLYGYIPEAAARPEGNGTEIVVSLQASDGSSRQLTRFLYNPAHNKNSQNPRQLRVLLPPGENRGAKLILETTPGPGNDDAWDWLYVTRVGLLHYAGFLPRQFPAFNRPPDAVESPLALLTGNARDAELLLHAPTRLQFKLTGHERTLDFTFGFRRGAFTQGGQTNGAIFRATVRRPGENTTTTLFEKLVDPVRNRTDRPLQRAMVDLPELPVGTMLELVIDPNGSNAWDWTIIDSLRLG